ncbi:hypothetical protein GCM10010191_42620 [Actinomadura vinacea]|uniref:non-specific serine/threonine protein kinase n=2 Tax=Actinomadura vinacea TaxID=115336 RepID=A0ABN3JBJ8_9ACTN
MVGRYRIDRVLGSGAFASVWLGHDEALDSQVAIKVLSGSLIDDLDVRNRFLEEARILRRADSSRLVRVHDIGELPDGRPYFVMSYADRGTLADRMRERPLPVGEALVLAEEIAYGVEVINALGVIHRDLKPSNVLFQSAPDGGERLLIADLGLAKALAHASGAFTLPVGTPGYMSPEQARFGGGLDVRADVYGLGALIYHMLTGRPPGPPPVRTAPSSLREGLTPAFDQVVLRALDVEREKRWPTAEAFAEALATLRPTGSPSTSNAGPGPGAPPPAVQEPPQTIQDQFYPADPSYSYAQGPGPAAPQPSHPEPPPPQPPASHGRPGPPPPPSVAPAQGYPPPPYPDQEPSTREEPPTPEDATRTSEVAPPPRPLDEQTIVDHPSRYGPPSPGPSGGADDSRTISFPQPPDPPGPPQPPGEEGKTSAFPVQGPTQGPPMGPGQGPGPGPAPGPGQGPGPGPGPGQGPPPTGFQPPSQPGGKPSEGPMARLKKLGLPGRPGGTGGGTGAGPGAAGRRSMIIAAIILSVALVGGLALGTLLSGGDEPSKPEKPAVPKDFVQVSDTGGKIRAAVPKAWPRGQEATWPPTSVGLNDPQARPVLRASPNVEDFKGDGKSPGVFIGLTTDVANGKLPPPNASRHGQCTRANPENYTSPDKALTGTITRFTGCRVGTPTVVEVGLRDKTGKFGAWIRVKETGNRNATKDILDNLKLTAP